MEIKSIVDLRNYALKTLEKLEKGTIDTAEAGVTGKLCESIVSTVKSEMEYAKMLGLQPKIKFMGDMTRNAPLTIEHEKKQKLLK